MFKSKSFSTCAKGNIKGRAQRIFSQIKIVLALAATVTGMELSVAPAKAAGAMWISAWNWSYSSALAQSPVGTAYFWAFSVGGNSYSWAYAYSVTPGVGSAYAFAEAAARRGGMGAVQVAGIADPFAGDSIGIPLVDPSNPGSWPTNDPASDPLSSSYTLSDMGATFTGSGSELSGDDEIQAFVYNGPIDEADLESEFGASSGNGTSLAGDVDSFSELESDFGSYLVPLDAPDDDPSSLSSLNFTENTGMIDANMDNVILVGEEDATVTPEPSATWLLGIGVASLLIFRKFRAAKVA
jgi:hypothetical protein